MSKIPTQTENPKGLHLRYFVLKINSFGALCPVDRDANYFVLRLDELCKDRSHLIACRAAINEYANSIEHHLPDVAKDIREKFPLITE